jgi:hypothetical protein
MDWNPADKDGVYVNIVAFDIFSYYAWNSMLLFIVYINIFIFDSIY